MTRFLLLSAVGALLATQARADFFDYDYRESDVAIHGEIPAAPPPNNEYTDSAYANDFAPFEAALANELEYETISVGGWANHSSTLSSTMITTAGEADAYALDTAGAGDALAWSASQLETTFDLASGALVRLFGELTEAEGNDPPYLLRAFVEFQRWDGEQFVDVFYAESPGDFWFEDDLEAGHYRLQVSAFVGNDLAISGPDASGYAGYDATLHIVPEPASLALLALAALRRRR